MAKKRSLKALDPNLFEHMVFDLMIANGMINVVWRSPGADGGRDIEGVSSDRDISGFEVTRKWFVECKRYSASVDWPTIYGKLAYADALRADYLLMCTTAKFSPNAITQVAEWNAKHRGSVNIRLWPINELEIQLQRHPDIALKYGLSAGPSTPGRSIVSLTLALSKSVSSYYANLMFNKAASIRMLESAQAISDLLLRRMEDIDRVGYVVPQLEGKPQSVEKCTFQGDNFAIDGPGLRAFVAYLAALLNTSLIVKKQSKGNCVIETKSQALKKVLTRYRDAFNSIATWADFEFSSAGLNVHIRQRQ